MTKRKIFEIGFSILIILAIVFTAYKDISRLFTLKIDVVRFLMTTHSSDLMQTIFSVQATVSTLGIALLSILGGVCKDTIYGISITKFITQTRPTILKHKSLVIAELILIVLGYFALTRVLYSTLIVIFISSIAIIGCMVNDIFWIFKGNRNIENEMTKYYDDLFKDASLDKKVVNEKLDAIYDISEHIKTSVFENKYVSFEKDIDFIEKLFMKHLTNPNISNDEQKDKVLSLMQEKIIDTSKEAFNNGNTNYIFKTIDFLTTIHHECNDRNASEKNYIYSKNSYIYLNIYDSINITLWKCISKFLCTDSQKLYFNLLSLRSELYNNMYFNQDGKLNNNLYLTIFSSRIYHMLLEKQSSFINKEEMLNYKKRLFSYLQSNLENDKINFKVYSIQKQNKVSEELDSYTKTLIDSMEVETLKETFFNNIQYYKKYTNWAQYNFKILIYIYYLAECEILIDKDKKAIYRDILKNKRNKMGTFIYDVCDLLYQNKISIEKIKNKYWSWERYPKNGCKTPIFEHTIDRFAIYWITYQCGDIDKMIKYASIIVQGNERGFATNYKKENYPNIVPKYKNFVKLFFVEDITDKEAKEKIELLHKACEILFKEKLLKESRDNKLDEQKIKTVGLDTKSKVMGELSNVISYFNNKKESIAIIPLEYIIENIEAVTFTRNNWFNTDFTYFINNWFSYVIINTIIGKLKPENKTFKNPKMLGEFLNKCSDFDIDTILGGDHNYFNYDQKDDYQKFIDNKNKITKGRIYDITLALDSSQCYFNIKNVDVSIRHCEMSEFQKKYEIVNEDEYSYQVQSDVILSFTKDELEEYIHNDKYQITIDIELEYGFASDNFGVALFANEIEKVVE